jgi:hypothetical protein
MSSYEVIINKKFNHIKLYNIKRSIKGDQNKVSKFVSSLVDKYILKKKATGEDRE